MLTKKFNNIETKKKQNDKFRYPLCFTPTITMLESTANQLSNRINSFINDIESQTKYIISKLIVKRAIGIGFLINAEEQRRGQKFNVF